MKLAFKLALSLLIPFATLLGIEYFLRLKNYGVNLDELFLTTENNQYLYMNKDISKRYFTHSQATTGNIEFFKKNKDEKTLRIFVLGESAALGFPYPNNISFQKMIKYELQKRNPDKDIEVVNLSLTAINSHTFYDFGKELITYQPDAILIYGGHNEYYGALGVASTNNFLISNSSVSRLFIQLRRSRLTQLLENIASSINKNTTVANDNLMKYVVGEQLIEYESKSFEKGINQFRSNMKDLLSLFDFVNIPVFLSTVPVNLKDQYPFKSTLMVSTDSSAFYTEMDKARNEYKNNHIKSSIEILEGLLRIDSTNADLHYLLGNVFNASGQRDSSFYHFNQASQMDCLRFRAPDEINRSIRELSSLFQNVHLVDSENAFIYESDDSIPGNKLFLEHVHPTIEGHRLIAKCFMQKMNEYSNLFDIKIPDMSFEDTVLNSFPVLEFDSLVGVYACAKLKTGFPFYEKQLTSEKYDTPIKRISKQYVEEKNWFKSMDELYDYAIKSESYTLAQNIMKVRILDNPYDINFYILAGNLCNCMKDYSNAYDYYSKAFILQNDYSVAKELIAVSLKMDKPDFTIRYLDYALATNQNGIDFKTLKTYCLEIIERKEKLRIYPTQALREEIKNIYISMGNIDAASFYN